jgi:hypothetical protein
MKFRLELGQATYGLLGWSLLHELARRHVLEEQEMSPCLLSQENKDDIYDAAFFGIPRTLEMLCQSNYDFTAHDFDFDLEFDYFSVLEEFAPALLFDTKTCYESESDLINRFNHSETANKYRLKLNARNPPSVARKAFELLQKSALERNRWGTTAWAIHMLGWVRLVQGGERKCAFCPARAELDAKYCEAHSQSFLNAGNRTGSKQYQQYRWGKRARDIAERFVLLEPYEHYLDAYEYLGEIENFARLRWHETRMKLPRSIAGNFSTLKYEVYLMSCILKSRRVLKRLGGRKLISSFSTFGEVIEHVIQRLDPYDRRIDFLQNTVEAFEIWFYLEELVRRKLRGQGKKTAKRVQHAIELAKEGYRNKDIAAALGVRQSTVSMWAKRDLHLKTCLKNSHQNRS